MQAAPAIPPHSHYHFRFQPKSTLYSLSIGGVFVNEVGRKAKVI